MGDMMLACRNVDPEIFFMPQTVRKAKNLCKKCPALEPCRRAVRDIEESFGPQVGVWAGLSEEDRKYSWARND